MPSKGEVLSQKVDRVKHLIQQFPTAASSLNNATDQFGKSIGQLEAVLKKFGLGIPTWVSFSEWWSDDNVHFSREELGYAKIGGRWGLAIRTVSGNIGPDPDDMECWLLPEAPRHLRMLATEAIPNLLEALLAEAAKMTEQISEKTAEVDALTAGIKSVVEPQNALAAAIPRARYRGGQPTVALPLTQPPDCYASVDIAAGNEALTQQLAGAKSIQGLAGAKARK